MESIKFNKINSMAITGLIAVSLGSILSSLDLFVVNLAFSSIRQSFPHSGIAPVSWVLTVYSVCFASTLVLWGRYADKYGRKKVFCFGLVLFGAASTICGLALSLGVLIFARAVQGIAAAMLIPTSLGLLLEAYPREKHKQMIGLWAATGSLAAAAGPGLGGLLVKSDWHLIFYINIPVVIVALLCASRLVESTVSETESPDVTGSVLLISGLVLLTGTIACLADWKLYPLYIISAGFLAALLIFLFIWHCLKAQRPVLDLRLFRVQTFTAATFGMACFYMSFSIMLLGGTLFLCQVWKLTPEVAGLAFTLGPGTAVLSSLIVGRVKLSPQTLALCGGLLYAISGIWWYFTLGADTDYAWLYFFLPGLILTGAGAGIAQTGFIAGGVAALPADVYSTGTGIMNTSRQIGAAIGVAIFVAVTNDGNSALAFRPAWLAMSIFGIIAAMAAVVFAAKNKNDHLLRE